MVRRLRAVHLLAVLLGILSAVYMTSAAAQQDLSTENIQIEVPPTIRTVQFTGNTLVSAEELRAAAGVKSGVLLNQQILTAAVENIRNAYCERGYMVAVTNITFPPPGQVGTLTFTLEEVRIAAVQFVGLKRVREDVVRGVIFTEPGELYNRRNVQQDLATLKGLDVFSSISPELQFQTPGQAVLIFRVEEKDKFNNIDLGGSIGAGQGVIVRVGLILANIGGRADKLRLDAFIGALEGQVGGRLSYYNPVVAKRTSLDAAAYDSFLYRFDNDFVTLAGEGFGQYYERHLGGQFYLTKRQTRDTTLAAGLRAEQVDVVNLPPEVFTNNLASLDNTVVLGRFRGIQDRRNSLDYPSKGSLTAAGMEAGWTDLKDDGSGGIARIAAAKAWYTPLGPPPKLCGDVELKFQPPVLAYRALAGTSFGDLPFTEQFFIGGLTPNTIEGITPVTLRGYRDDRFWGKYAILASVEYRRPLSNKIIGVAFVDMGDAWGSDYQFVSNPPVNTDFRQHENFSPRFGAGVGVRYRSPFGPLLLDFSYGERFTVDFSIGTFL